MTYTYQESYPQPHAAGRGYGALGFFAALGILYLVFYMTPTAFPREQAVLIGAAAVFAGGFISRGAKRGATIGFLLLFLPLVFSGVLLFAGGFLGPVAEMFPGLPVVFRDLALGIGTGLVASEGLALIVAGLVAGLIGAIIGGIGGLISSKLLPVGGRSEEGDGEESWDHPPGQGGGSW